MGNIGEKIELGISRLFRLFTQFDQLVSLTGNFFILTDQLCIYFPVFSEIIEQYGSHDQCQCQNNGDDDDDIWFVPSDDELFVYSFLSFIDILLLSQNLIILQFQDPYVCRIDNACVQNVFFFEIPLIQNVHCRDNGFLTAGGIQHCSWNTFISHHTHSQTV